MPATISFEEHFFPHIAISANPKFNPASKTSDEAVEITIGSNISAQKVSEDSSRYLSELRVKIDQANSPASPYFMDIACLCFLEVENAASEEEARSEATRAAHEMLFPAVRELVLNLTARQPWGQFSIGLAALRNTADTADASPPSSGKKAAPKRKRTKEDAAS